MQSLHAQLEAACEEDLGLKTPSAFPSFDDEKFPAEYFLYNLLRKEEPFKEKSDVPASVLRSSLSKFADSEWRCRVMNVCGRFYTPLVDEDMIFFSEALRLAKSWISRTTMECWPKWEDAGYTSGASLQSSRSVSMSYLKAGGYTERGKMSGTKSAHSIVAREIAPEWGPHWTYSAVEVVDYCRFDFVHKTAKDVRFMTPQPEYNMLAQKCVGDCIREALLAETIDLREQGWNQELAYVGSITREIATIDLSNSSDNVALFHGEALLPDRIMEYCMSTRVTHTKVGDYSHRLNKLATMGNGFIFEIQSLIYAGLAYAVTSLKGGREHDVAVYGDDIVISTCCAEPLMDLLVYLGMEPNLSKSYWGDVPFRESCGKHYYAGRDVTPFYIKEPLETYDETGNRIVNRRALFRAINGLKYWETRTGLKLHSAIKLLVKQLDKKDRLVVPSTYSVDCGLHFAVSGCKFPKRVKTEEGDLRVAFKILTDQVQDIKARIGDWTLYVDWLRNPPAGLIEDDDIWRKLQERTGKHENHGYPRALKSYSRVLDVETHPATWASVSASLDDVT